MLFNNIIMLSAVGITPWRIKKDDRNFVYQTSRDFNKEEQVLHPGNPNKKVNTSKLLLGRRPPISTYTYLRTPNSYANIPVINPEGLTGGFIDLRKPKKRKPKKKVIKKKKPKKKQMKKKGKK